MKLANLEVSEERVAAFSKKWKVEELSLFGSALREDFGPESDVDVLVSLLPGEEMTLESYLDMRDELSAMFGGREVDLMQKRLVKNPYQRQAILESREILYGG